MKREFLGWDRPALPAAAEYLVGRHASAGTVDLRDVVVVLPGARAGRRLLEILVDEADRRGLTLSPPRIMTAGGLAELLYEPSQPLAGELVRELAWAEALRSMEPATQNRLVPDPPPRDDPLGWLALAELVARLHIELGGEGLDFAGVAERGGQVEGSAEWDRWQALAAIQRDYLRRLAELGLADPQVARLTAIRQKACTSESSILLVGTADINSALCRMLDQVSQQVTALVQAPLELADRFDEHGRIRPEAWRDVRLELATERVVVVDGPADQAAAALRAIAAFDGRFSAEEITVGVPDKHVVPYLEQLFEQFELPVRYADGLALSQTGPYRLLAAVAEYVERRRFADFAALVRHPDLESWLSSCLAGFPRDGSAERGDWLSELDRYYAEHLPPNLAGRWLGGSRPRGRLERVHAAVEKLVAGLCRAPQSLDQWAEPILKLLLDVYGRQELDRAKPLARIVLEACDQIHAVLADEVTLDGRLAPVVTAADAIRWNLRRLERESIPPLPDQGAIELLGWLELPLDDAPALIVTGFNDGLVPQCVNADLFLPNALRRRLGLVDNDRRYARDAYALGVLLASRAQVTLVAGRRTAESDPLVPSRLLFACDSETLVQRTLAFFAPAASPSESPRVPGGLTAGRGESEFSVPRPRPFAAPFTSLHVTQFRDYLACPYRYYLRHVLALECLDDSADELDPAAFGSLVHQALCRFGSGAAAASTGAGEIARQLDDALDGLARARYGQNRLPAVNVQIEQLRLRLRAFAHWQAGWAKLGWRIAHTEAAVGERQAPLLVDGEPMFLQGRLDRIDVNDATGECIVLDYKTSDAARTPDETHRSRGEWVDLQLPLYRHLAASLGLAGPVRLGYIVLPKDTSRVGCHLAEWTEADLALADETARDVIRKIRRQEFWPPAAAPPAFAQDFAAICQDEQFGAVGLAAEEAQP